MSDLKTNPKEKRTLDVTSGPMLKKMIFFAIPVMLSGILQQAFNTADSIVVGRWAGAEALGGVSACASLINLIICIFGGLSVGAMVAISQALGAKDDRGASTHAHNALATAIAGGIVVAIIGVTLARPILTLMGTPEANIEYSVKYMRIYFCGAPFLLLYNYGSAILRTVGDTKRPLIYLAIGGAANVLLNVVMVVVLGMDSDGVAIATVVSNVISSLLVFYTLMHSEHCCRIFPSRIRISIPEFKKIIALGLPAGIQSGLFSLSNVVVQSSINSFGSDVVAGNGAAISVEAYSSYMSDGFSQTATTFAGQNTGAKKYKRLKTVFFQSTLCGMAFVSIYALIILPFEKPIISIFIPDNPVAVAAGCERLWWTLAPHCVGTLMTVTSSCMRGMGKSLMPMIITVFGVCVLRMAWIATVFTKLRTIASLYLIYPLTWSVTAIALIVMFWWYYRKLFASGKDQLIR